MRNYRTLDEITEQYFRDRPEEIDEFLTIIFQDYAEDNDTGTLLSFLHMLARVRGVGSIAEISSSPSFENVNSILKSMGYRLMPQKLESGPRRNNGG